jgi:hypothetical protein
MGNENGGKILYGTRRKKENLEGEGMK